MKPNEELIQKIMQWLGSMHVTMWGGEGWTVTKEDTCRKAAEWFAAQMQDFVEWDNANG